MSEWSLFELCGVSLMEHYKDVKVTGKFPSCHFLKKKRKNKKEEIISKDRIAFGKASIWNNEKIRQDDNSTSQSH